MRKYDKKIKELDECPHCNSTAGYYQKHYVSGQVQISKDFNGKYNCSETYDYLNWSRPSKYLFCLQCHNRLAKAEN